MDRRRILLLIAIFFVVLFVYDAYRFATQKPKAGTGQLGPVDDTLKFPEPTTTTEEPLQLGMLNNSSASPLDQPHEDEPIENITGEIENQSEEIENNTEGTEPSAEAIDEELPEEEPKSVKVTYFFFTASYCNTCKAMIPMIEKVEKRHPKLSVQIIDVHSGSRYVNGFGVTATATSVILREEDGEAVSGTKVMGFMDERGIESFICTELEDERCEKL